MNDTDRYDPARPIDRRTFLKTGAVAAGAPLGIGLVGCREDTTSANVVTLPERDVGFAPKQLPVSPPLDLVRIGFVGVGGQGTWHVKNFLKIDGVRIDAICDVRPEHAERSRQLVLEAGGKEPRLYIRGDRDFVRMCEQEDLDLVFTATPWRWHVPVCIAAMRNGKHAATEVPAATTIDGCWELVETAEKENRHCVMMENCNYGRAELMVLNMIRKGVFGELIHAECGYLHDLREIKFSAEGEGLWRRDHARRRNGNLYPTHGLGPVGQYLNINRGDRFDYLVSMSSNARGLQAYAEAHFKDDAPERNESFVLGDVNTSLVKTATGKTIFLSHDTNLPRPYSRINLLQGTRGIFQGYPDRVYIEGRSAEHQWESTDSLREEYDHPLWRRLESDARGAAHGGMDYLEDHRLIHCLRNGLPTDMNVYDAAALSAVCELTEISVARNSIPVAFPDFTRGRWKAWPPLEIWTT